MSLELILALIGAVGSIVIPFVLYSMRNQNEKIKTMEERIFHLHGSSVSKDELKEELRQLERRVAENISSKLELVNTNIESIKELIKMKFKVDD